MEGSKRRARYFFSCILSKSILLLLVSPESPTLYLRIIYHESSIWRIPMIYMPHAHGCTMFHLILESYNSNLHLPHSLLCPFFSFPHLPLFLPSLSSFSSPIHFLSFSSGSSPASAVVFSTHPPVQYVSAVNTSRHTKRD